jgi:recombinational DNA repair protein RecR
VSNHSGSYMLNDVLRMLERYSVFDMLGDKKTQELVLEIVRMSDDYDCNVDEILDNIGEHVGVCYDCLRPAREFRDGICKECWERDSALSKD